MSKIDKKAKIIFSNKPQINFKKKLEDIFNYIYFLNCPESKRQ